MGLGKQKIAPHRKTGRKKACFWRSFAFFDKLLAFSVMLRDRGASQSNLRLESPKKICLGNTLTPTLEHHSQEPEAYTDQHNAREGGNGPFMGITVRNAGCRLWDASTVMEKVTRCNGSDKKRVSKLRQCWWVGAWKRLHLKYDLKTLATANTAAVGADTAVQACTHSICFPNPHTKANFRVSARPRQQGRSSQAVSVCPSICHTLEVAERHFVSSSLLPVGLNVC